MDDQSLLQAVGGHAGKLVESIATQSVTLGEQRNDARWPYVLPLRFLRERGCLSTARAMLTENGDDPASALALYGEAETLWEEAGHVVYRNEAVLGAGRCLLALGRSKEGAVKLRLAGKFFAGLGARPLAAEADLLLQRASGTGA